jgi:hypothetical protein
MRMKLELFAYGTPLTTRVVGVVPLACVKRIWPTAFRSIVKSPGVLSAPATDPDTVYSVDGATKPPV